MDSWSKDQLLAMQQQMTQYGTVVYERGIEVIEKTGWFVIVNGAVILFGDNATPLDEQNRTVIPNPRLIELRVDGEPSL